MQDRAPLTPAERQRRYYAKRREEVLAKARARYHADPEKEKERHRKWVEKNGERLREYNRARYAKNPTSKIARAKKYRDDNPGYCAAYSKQWVKDNPERARLLDRSAKARRRASGSFTPDDIIAIEKMQRGKCAYCRIGLTEANRNIDHIMPIALGGSNNKDNLQLLCVACNKTKSAKHPIAFAQSLGRLL